MARIILCVLLLALFSFGLHGSTQNQYKSDVTTILHYEHVDQRDVALEDVSLKRGMDSHEEIAINLVAFGKTMTLNLVKNRELFSADSMVMVHGENGTLLNSYPTPLIAYREKDEDPFHSRITIFDYDNLQLKGVWATEEDTFYIDPVHEHADSMKRDVPVTVSHVIYRERDIMNNDIIKSGKNENSYPSFVFPKSKGNHTTAKRNEHGSDLFPNTQAAASRSPPPSPCPQTVKYFSQSVATDYKYTSKLGGEAAARREITNNWNVISALYVKTVNINIMLDEIVINTQSSSVEWNTQSCQTIENMLYSFSQWRGTRNKNAGLWHLLTNCFPPPGTVGLAWLSVTCETGGGLPSGTGVSTYLSGSNGYRVCAHETGHNFGANHDSDGVMTASLQNIDFFSAATQAAMCNHIKSSTSRCYKDSPSNTPTPTPTPTPTRSSTTRSTSTPSTTTSPRCVPSCGSKQCGSDGCGGTCGSCDNSRVCVYGVCQRITPRCTPNCNRKNCGSDGCGGTCGRCSGSQSCNSRGVCQRSRDAGGVETTPETCIRSCAGKTCGFDGCSGSCGECAYPQSCDFNLGKCQNIAYNPICTPVCDGKQCGFDGCGGSCGSCPKNEVCDIGSGLCETAFIATEEDIGANNDTYVNEPKNASSSMKSLSVLLLIVLAYIVM